MSTLSELRRHVEERPDCQLVTADIYIECLTGHQALVRSDEPSANLVGLLNETTGQRILVRVEELAVRRTHSVLQLS